MPGPARRTGDGRSRLPGDLPEILDLVVWPALRAAGYIIDNDFTDAENLVELHREALEEAKNNSY